jgi:uncharacterized protein YuzE
MASIGDERSPASGIGTWQEENISVRIQTTKNGVFVAGGGGWRRWFANRNHDVSNDEYRKVLEKSLKLSYDKETDTLTITFSEKKIKESDESRPGVIIDYDTKGGIVSIEILDASQRMDNPTSVEFALAA